MPSSAFDGRGAEQDGHTPALPQLATLRIGHRHLDRRVGQSGFVGDPLRLIAGVTVELQHLDGHAVHFAEIQRLIAVPIGRAGSETQLGGLHLLAAARQQRQLAAMGQRDRLGGLALPEHAAGLRFPGPASE